MIHLISAEDGARAAQVKRMRWAWPATPCWGTSIAGSAAAAERLFVVELPKSFEARKGMKGLGYDHVKLLYHVACYVVCMTICQKLLTEVLHLLLPIYSTSTTKN